MVQHLGWSWWKSQPATTGVLALAIVLGLMVAAPQCAAAQGHNGFTLVYSFTNGTDGGFPFGGLLADQTGNVYGTTLQGGSFDLGTVFKIDKTGVETVLHNFAGPPDGQCPLGDLIADAAGNLYGVTQGGGIGAGTVFKLDMTGTENVLHSFTGNPDGDTPLGGLVRDMAGNLYGTTASGGTSNFGTVFKLDTTGVETVLYSFRGGVDGGNPFAGLLGDIAGNFYGTTLIGGAGTRGTVFKVDSLGVETVLHDFTNGKDGGNPYAALIRDAAGNLYGTTETGGTSSMGTVFKLDSTRTETVLYSFTGGAVSLRPSGRCLLSEVSLTR